MSIKKLGGTRLRLIAGLSVAMAVCGLALASKPLSFAFDPDTVEPGTKALLVLDDVPQGVYCLVPIDRENESQLEGWAHSGSGDGTGEFEDPYVFDEDTIPYIQITVGSGGHLEVFIQTDTISEMDDLKEQSVELRELTPDGDWVATADIDLLVQTAR